MFYIKCELNKNTIIKVKCQTKLMVYRKTNDICKRPYYGTKHRNTKSVFINYFYVYYFKYLGNNNHEKPKGGLNIIMHYMKYVK